MPNNVNCKHSSVAPYNLLERLDESQAGPGRHKCGTCAYSYGFALAGSTRFSSYGDYSKRLTNYYECGHGSVAPTRLLESLSESQGGPARHKCVTCAFKLGFNVGLTDTDLTNMIIKESPVPNYPLEKLVEKKFTPQGNRAQNDEKNAFLGDLGEKAVVIHERRFLSEHGLTSLAEKVEQVSATLGDHLGFDILSYYPSGNEKWIEVKTTTGAKNTKFHLSENQIQRSEGARKKFWLYRLYDFNPELAATSMYKLQGSLRDNLNLYPTNYTALPK